MPKPSKSIQDARRSIFTDYGYIALESVITGRVKHRRAMEALSVLRDLMLDDHKDPRLAMKVEKWFSNHHMTKGTDFTYLHENA